ncbi:MAG: hypothetical protein RQ722_12815, partial [Desulfuromonadales bacterium]|nr:hypothetical protein [Desulfuromonadales bacterium]
MKNKNCPSEQDLILHYYGELPATDERVHHLADCPLCEKRVSALRHDLAKLPDLSHEPDFAAGTRMAARVNERLNRRRRNWIPVLGASSAAAVAVVITLSIWSPMSQQKQTVQYPLQPLTVASLNEDMPDIDFIEDL